MVESVLSILDLSDDDKIIAIRENNLADANFLLSSILSKSFENKENVCLVILHNTIGHYHNVGKRLNFDLLKQIENGHARVIEPLKDVVKDISCDGTYLSCQGEEIVKRLFYDVKKNIDELKMNVGRINLIVDDVSNLMDLNTGLPSAMNFAKYCCSFTSEEVRFVTNCHVACEADEILSNLFFYMADMTITVSALQTGRSKHVSGVMTMARRNTCNALNKQNVYHFKLMDKEILIFAPGRAII